jgi:adenylate cyclase
MRWLVGILLIAGLVGIKSLDPYPIEVLRLKTFDYFISTIEPTESEIITLISVDDESLNMIGQWPWPRNAFCSLLGSGITGITVLFPEEDRYGTDEDFSNCMSNVVVSTAATNSKIGGQPPHVGTASIGSSPLPYLTAFDGILNNVQDIESMAVGNGITSTAFELDGLVRRIPLVFNIGETLYPSFSMEILRGLAGAPSYAIKSSDIGVDALRIQNFPIIKTDSQARIWVNWNTSFKTISAADYFKHPKPNTVAIIGVTAKGTSTLVATPAGLKAPHEVQAAVLSTLITGTNISRPRWAEDTELLVLLGGLLILLLLSFKVYLSLPALLVAVGGTIWYTMDAFATQQILLDPSFGVLAALILWAVSSFTNYLREFKLKQQIKKQFEHYLDPRMVKKLQQNPKLLKLGGERRDMTFLFSDIRGFTPISEKFKDNPEQLVELVNRFLTNQTNIILEHGGTVDKYMGDCIMAFWNAPLDDPEQKENATRAAIAMRLALEELNDVLSSEGDIEIRTGVGINSGACVVGNMGSDKRFDYSVIGDAVNLASRLESSCKTYNTDLIISEVSRVEGYEYTYLDEVTVKGKSEPVKIYTIQK